MKIKEFLKEKKELIKANRRLIAVGCGLSGIMISVPSIIGPLTAHQAKNKKDKEKYYYTPGEIRFDENGKLIFPEVIDEDNPSGIYKYSPKEYQDLEINYNLINSESVKNKIDYFCKTNIKNIKTLCIDFLDKSFIINEKIKLLIDNIIPNNSIRMYDEIKVDDFINLIFENSLDNYKNIILSSNEIHNLCSLSGINFYKEYNKVMLEIENNVNTYGGSGVKPPTNTPPPTPDYELIDENQLTWIQQLDIINQNTEYLYIFAITNTIILPILTTLSVTFTLLSFFLEVQVQQR